MVLQSEPGLTISLNYILELRLSVRLAKTFVIFMPTINKARFLASCTHEKIFIPTTVMALAE